MISSAASPSTVADDPAAHLRHPVGLLVVGDRERDRGSRSRLRALREAGWVKNTTWSPSMPVQTGTECGAPLGSTVARWA